MLSAADLHERGKNAANSGRFRQARRSLTTGLERAEDEATLARIEGTLSYVEAELGDPRRGLELLDRALGREAALPALERGVLAALRALLKARLGDFDQALPDFALALPLLAGSPLELGTAHLNRGSLWLEQGDPARAVRDFEQAMVFLDQAGNATARAKAEHNLGYAVMLQGDLARALTRMDAAIAVLSGQSAALTAMCAQDRAEALLAAGMVDDGVDALRAAAQGFAAQRLPRYQAEAELVLARALALSRPAEAARVARAAARRFTRVGAARQALRCEAVEALCRMELGQRVAGTTELAAELRQARLDRDALMIELVRAANGGDEAPPVPAGAPLLVRLAGHEYRARAAAARGDTPAALRATRAGLALLQRWQAGFGSLDLLTALATHGNHLAGAGLDLALATGRPAAVYEWIERTGALAGRIVPVRPPSDPQTAADLTELRVLAQRAPEAGTPEAARQAVLVRRVRQQAWGGEGSAQLSGTVPLARVKDELTATDACLFAPFVAGGRAQALVVADGHARLIQLGPVARIRAELSGLPADLDLAAADLPPSIAGAVRGSLLARLAELDDLILGPVVPALTRRRVVINPLGIFSGLPWTLMPSLAGRPLTIPRSASAWLRARRRPHEYAVAGFAAGPRLERSEPEVDRAAAHWARSEVLVGPGARADAVSALAARVDVLHLAAHGHHESENPLFSSLQLVDGPWYGYDLDQLADIPEVVILSACELGATTIRRGDELLGLTTAWLHAGARCVIAAPASVSDAVAAAILPAVHAELAAGTMPADALAIAVAAHPDLLSTFQCYGAGW